MVFVMQTVEKVEDKDEIDDKNKPALEQNPQEDKVNTAVHCVV